MEEMPTVHPSENKAGLGARGAQPEPGYRQLCTCKSVGLVVKE